MAGFDRSKFRGASASQRKKQVERNQKQTGVQRREGSGINYIRLEKGENTYLRVFPIHPKTIENLGDDASNMYPKTSHFINTMVEIDEDGVKSKEKKKKQHLSSKVHGGTPKCLIDEFISFAIHLSKELYPDSEDAQKKYLHPILDWKEGIKGRTQWQAYVKKYANKKGDSPELGIISLPVSVIDKMNELSAGSDDPEDVMATDIFSDPDKGFMMIVKSDPEAGKKDPKKYYQVSIDPLAGSDPLTDSDLEWLMEQKPLDEQYVNIYKAKDFYRTLDALKMLDEDNDMGIFGEDEFLDVVEEIAGYYPEEDMEDEKKKSGEDIEEMFDEKPAKKAKKTPVAQEESDLPFDKKLDDMSKSELKGYIRRNKLDITVLPEYTEEDLVKFIREEEALAEVEEPAAKAAPKKKRSSRAAALAEGLEDDEDED